MGTARAGEAAVITEGADPAEWFDLAGDHPRVMQPVVEPPGATVGSVLEVHPAECPNGHPLAPPNVQVAWLPCRCTEHGGHRTVRCWRCDAVWYRPAHIDPAQSFDRWSDRLPTP